MKETESRNLKEEILTVTGRMFIEYGYSGTTYKKIVDELNITKGAITNHLKNKFMIMETPIDDLFSQIKGYVESIPEEY